MAAAAGVSEVGDMNYCQENRIGLLKLQVWDVSTKIIFVYVMITERESKESKAMAT